MEFAFLSCRITTGRQEPPGEMKLRRSDYKHPARIKGHEFRDSGLPVNMYRKSWNISGEWARGFRIFDGLALFLESVWARGRYSDMDLFTEESALWEGTDGVSEAGVALETGAALAAGVALGAKEALQNEGAWSARFPIAEKDLELVASLGAKSQEDDRVSRPCEILVPNSEVPELPMKII